jgi:hypothetical protein
VLIDVAANPDVEGERLLEMLHHIARAGGPPDRERHRALPGRPSGEEQVWELEHVVRMQVREEHSCDRAERHAGLRESQRCPTAAVEQEALPTGLDERARPVLPQVDHRPRAGAEQDDLEAIGRHRRGRRW